MLEVITSGWIGQEGSRSSSSGWVCPDVPIDVEIVVRVFDGVGFAGSISTVAGVIMRVLKVIGPVRAMPIVPWRSLEYYGAVEIVRATGCFYQALEGAGRK